MRRSLLITLSLAALAACRAALPPELGAARAADGAGGAQLAPLPPPSVGEPAPAFVLTDLEGRTWDLAALAGRPAVLLWFDPECTFLVHAYEHGDLAERAARIAEGGVVWLSIAPTGPEMGDDTRERSTDFVAAHGVPHPVVLDDNGAVARAFGARLAGEVLVLAPDATVVYRGALDNAPFGIVRGGFERRNYVEEALAALARGARPQMQTTEPYGCRLRITHP